MSNKKNKTEAMLDRRRFLAGASILLGSVGVAPLVRNELLQKIANKILPVAHAANSSNQIDFMIELCGRSGSPLLWLGTGQAFTAAGGSQYPNAGINQVSDLQQVAGNGNTALFMNNVNGGGNSVASLLRQHADNIAISQGFDANGLGHTPLFGHREGQKGMGLTTPIIEFADRAKRNPAYDSLIVHGVNWMRGGNVMNQTNGTQDLVDVGSAQQFTSLFREPVLRLNRNEVGFVAEAAKALSQIQANRLKNRINNVDNVARSQEKGADLLTRDYSQLLNVSQLSPGFRMGQNVGNRNWGDIGSALAYTCKAFESGLISSSTITYNSGDWHGFQTPGNNSIQAQAGLAFASMLNATIAFLKATPHPFRAGESLWDRTLIQIGSEFTRGVSFMGQDNNDGGTTGFALMGGRVVGGYYGGFDLPSGSGGRAYGFNPATGATTSGMRNGTGQIYNTVNAWLGNSSKVSGAALMTCLMRA